MTNETMVGGSEGAIEVTASWGGTTLSSALLSGEDRLVIGPSGTGWLTLPADVLAQDLTLVECVDGRWTVRAPKSAELELGECGAAHYEDSSDLLTLTIGAGERSAIRFGEFRFEVRSTARETAPTRRPVGYGWMRWLGVAAVLHGVVLALFALMPPNVSALNVDSLSAQTRYVTVSLPNAAQETLPSETPHTPTEQTASAPEGGPGGPSESPVITESSTDAPRRSHGTFQPVPTQTATAENVSEMGILAVMAQQSWGDDASPFAAGSERAGEGGLSLSQILSLRSGPSHGPGLTGPGHGTCRGDNCGLSTLAVGPLHTQPGADVPRVHLRDRVAPTGPTIRTLPPQVTSSGLSREQVRRTIRRHIGEVRFCYEQQLQSRPDLEGRVAVQFVISQGGRVQAAQVASNTTRNAGVGSCVQQAVSRWTFPQSASPTGVTYPFLLSSN